MDLAETWFEMMKWGCECTANQTKSFAGWPKTLGAKVWVQLYLTFFLYYYFFLSFQSTTIPNCTSNKKKKQLSQHIKRKRNSIPVSIKKHPFPSTHGRLAPSIAPGPGLAPHAKPFHGSSLRLTRHPRRRHVRRPSPLNGGMHGRNRTTHPCYYYFSRHSMMIPGGSMMFPPVTCLCRMPFSWRRHTWCLSRSDVQLKGTRPSMTLRGPRAIRSLPPWLPHRCWRHLGMANNVTEGSFRFLCTKKSFSIFWVAKNRFFCEEPTKYLWQNWHNINFSKILDHI